MNQPAETSRAENLPPLKYRLYDPCDPEQKIPKIPTPTDQYGLIDVVQLIEDVKATIHPSYTWPRNTSVHHIYWEQRNYPYVHGVPGSWNPATFRELPIHKIRVPRTFENWLHRVTIEPSPPDPEIMHYRVLAFNQACAIYKKANATVKWDRRLRRRRDRVAFDPSFLPREFNGVDYYGEETLTEIIDREFDAMISHIDEQETIPAEYRLIKETDTPQKIATILGKLVVPRSQNMVWRVAA